MYVIKHTKSSPLSIYLMLVLFVIAIAGGFVSATLLQMTYAFELPKVDKLNSHIPLILSFKVLGGPHNDENPK